MPETNSCVGCGKSPLNDAVADVPVGFPRGDFLREFFFGADATVEALACQNSEFNFGDIHPTTAPRREMNFQSPGQPMCLLGGERLVQRGDRMCVEIVANELEAFGMRIIFLQQPTNFFCPVNAGSVVATTDSSPSSERIEKHEDGLHAVPFIMIVFTGHTS